MSHYIQQETVSQIHIRLLLSHIFKKRKKLARYTLVQNINSKAYFSGRGYNLKGRALLPIGAQSNVGGLRTTIHLTFTLLL